MHQSDKVPGFTPAGCLDPLRCSTAALGAPQPCATAPQCCCRTPGSGPQARTLGGQATHAAPDHLPANPPCLPVGLQELATLLAKLKAGGHKCLIFTQMSKMLDVLEVRLDSAINEFYVDRR